MCLKGIIWPSDGENWHGALRFSPARFCFSHCGRLSCKTNAGKRYNPVEMISIRAIMPNTLKDPLPLIAMPGKAAR
jgi:hypothetical protein